MSIDAWVMALRHFGVVPASMEAERQFRRHALLAILATAILTSLVTLALALTLDFALKDKIGLTLVTLKNLVFFAWLKRSKRSFALVGFLHFMILAATTVLKFGHVVLVDQLAFGFGAYVYWLPVTYIVAFLVFRGPVALVAAVTVYLMYLGVGGAFWASSSIPADLKLRFAYLFVQIYLTHATFISIFACFGVLLNRYMNAIRQAESEAKFANADDLTGLPNRRQLSAWLKSHLERASVTGEPLSVILFDLDHFKHVNDTFGHDAGDTVLRETGKSVTNALRRGTPFGRWGGEEFLVILPGTDAEQAGIIAERVRTAVSAAMHGPIGRVTASCGVAQALPGETVEVLLKRADEASYEAKRMGRDCVSTAA